MLSKGVSTENVLDWFDDESTINYISGILANDFEITDVNKAIEDIEKTYLISEQLAQKHCRFIAVLLCAKNCYIIFFRTF